ncbi:MAG: hypothetical protein JJU07_07000 [Natronohydrobacter sp.]|nr:hypothetical protein [Natronohydrobacter sp.]
MDQSEEPPAWERINSADWLRRPYFRDDNPDWIDEVRSIVGEGLRKKKCEEIELTDAQINELELILARYIKAHAEWEGWLNKGDKDRLEDVQACAQKLHNAILKLKEAEDETDRPADWYLGALLRDRDDCGSLDQHEDLLELLKTFEIRSPVFDEGGHGKKLFPSPSVDAVRAQLQGDTDNWWKRVTGLSRAKHDYKAPAYHKFLTATFGRILNAPPGNSSRAIANARKSVKYNRAKAKARRQAINSAFKTNEGQ